MKSDELIEDYCFDATDNQTKAVYPKAEVDSAIAELKEVYKESVDVKVKIWERCKKAEDEIRRMKRALWMARAKAYRYIAELITCFNPDYVRNRKMFTPNNQKQKQMNSLEWARLMLKVESKCRAKAEEYK